LREFFWQALIKYGVVSWKNAISCIKAILLAS
jgi:hypothetical protein